MAHRRLESLKELIVLQDKMERFFENDGISLSSIAQVWLPPIDMFETADEVMIRAEIPGVEEKDVRIELSGNYITLQGQRRLKTGCERYLHMERSYGPFQRTFRLPVVVTKEAVHAEYRFGVLTVSIQKQKGTTPAYERVEID